jgi:hypothetical protein
MNRPLKPTWPLRYYLRLANAKTENLELVYKNRDYKIYKIE